MLRPAFDVVCGVHGDISARGVGAADEDAATDADGARLMYPGSAGLGRRRPEHVSELSSKLRVSGEDLVKMIGDSRLSVDIVWRLNKAFQGAARLRSTRSRLSARSHISSRLAVIGASTARPAR